MKTLFFIYDKSQAKKAYQYYQKNRKKEIIVLFPLNNNAYFYLKTKGVNLKKVTEFFLKKQKPRFPDCLKLNKSLSQQKYFKKLVVSKNYQFIKLFRLYLDYWLAILFETRDFIIAAIKFFNPDKIIAFERINLKSFLHQDISFSFLNSNIKKIRPKAKISLLKEKPPEKHKYKDNRLFFLTKILISNLLNNPIALLKLVYYFTRSRLFYLLSKNDKKTSTYNLLLYAHKHQLKNLIPLINKIKKDEALNLNLITKGLRLDEMLLLEKEQIKYFDINSFSNQDKEKETALKSQKIIKFFTNKKTKLFLSKFFNKKGHPLLAEPYYYLLAKVIADYYEQTLRFYYSIEKIFGKLKPDIILNINDFKPSSILLIKEARLKKIPTLLLQHGFAGTEKVLDFISDYYAVWGKHVFKKCCIKKSKKRKKQVKICGNFYLDHLKHDLNHVKCGLGSKPKLQNKRLITIGCLTTIYISEFKHAIPYYELIRRISEMRLDQIRFQVILKTHPGQNSKDLKSYKSSLVKFIQASDIIITEDTTAGIDATLYKKPLIYFNPCYTFYNPAFLKYKATFFANDIDDILKQIKKIITRPALVKKMFENQEKLIKDCYYKLDGKSCERLIDFIKEILRQKNKDKTNSSDI